MKKKSIREACTVPCSQNVIEESRCECINMAMMINKSRDAGIGSVTVSFNYCHVNDRDELIKYLEDNCWDFEEESIFTREEEEKHEET